MSIEADKKEEAPKKLGNWMPPKIGDIIKSPNDDKRSYFVIRELGRGGMGVVLLVKDQATKKEFAMKCEHQPKIKGDDRNLRLQNEVMAMLGFRTRRAPHLLHAIDYGTYLDFAFVVMPLIWKTLSNLAEIVDEKNKKGKKLFSKSTAIQIAIQTLQGIQTMHDLGFLHRDIKPDNIAVGKQRTKVYLLDYGLCRYYRRQDGCHLHPRGNYRFAGTLLYASIRGLRGIDQCRADDIETWFYVMFPFISRNKGATYLDPMTDEELCEEVKRVEEAAAKAEAAAMAEKKEKKKETEEGAQATIRKDNQEKINDQTTVQSESMGNSIDSQEGNARRKSGKEGSKDDNNENPAAKNNNPGKEDMEKAQKNINIQRKANLLEKDLPRNWDLPQAMNMIREYIVSLSWYDRPDYDYILQLLKQIDTVEKWCNLNEPLDWLKPEILDKIAKEDGGKKRDEKSLRFQ